MLSSLIILEAFGKDVFATISPLSLFSNMILICHFQKKKKLNMLLQYFQSDYIFKYSQIKPLIAVSMDRKGTNPKVPGPCCACFCDYIFGQILFCHRPLSKQECFSSAVQKVLGQKSSKTQKFCMKVWPCIQWWALPIERDFRWLRTEQRKKKRFKHYILYPSLFRCPSKKPFLL